MDLMESEQPWTPALTLSSSVIWYFPLLGALAKSAEPQQPLQPLSSCEHWQKDMKVTWQQGWAGL